MKTVNLNNHDLELRKKILCEVKETGNIALVARTHGLKYQTIFAWVRNERRAPLKKKVKAMQEQERKLERLELENRILKELLKKTNLAWLSDDSLQMPS